MEKKSLKKLKVILFRNENFNVPKKYIKKDYFSLKNLIH
jgi:hypothetical protein